MKTVIGLSMIICGIALGIYVGIWICFIGGICQIIEQVKAETLVPMTVALGVLKIMGAGLVGLLSAIFLVVPGGAMLAGDK